MPITPFHGGIGLVLKGAAGRSFSFSLFCCAQVAIDFESGYHLVRGDWPVHSFFHTFIGATIMSAVVVASLRRPVSAALRILARQTHMRRWIGTPEIPGRTVIPTALAGCVGHVVPDAIMHADVHPFGPFTSANPFYKAVALGPLHLGLAILGAVGLAWVLLSGRQRGSG